MWAERERQGCVGNLCWTLKTAICRQRILLVPADEPDPALSRKSRGWAAIPGTQPGLHSLKEGSFREKRRWFYWRIAVRTKWSTVEIKYLSGEKWSQSRNNVSGTTNHVKHWHNASVPSVMPQPACQQCMCWYSLPSGSPLSSPATISNSCLLPSSKTGAENRRPECRDGGLEVRKAVGGP